MEFSKNKIFGTLAFVLTAVLTLGLVFSNLDTKSPLFGTKAENAHQLVLDSSNAVSSSGDHVHVSKTGGQVTFTYTNVAASSGNHVKLNTNGTIVNKDIIHSITSFKVDYSGEGVLKARIAYITSKWGEYFDFNSNQLVSTGTNPYFIELKAFDNSVTIKSVTFNYSCSVNEDAESQDTSGSYDITFADAGADSSTEITTSANVMEQVETGSSYISSFSGISKIYAGNGGLKFGSSKATGSLTINFNSSNVKENISTVTIDTAQYGTDTGNFRVYVNGASSYTTITPSAGGSVEVGAKLTSLEIETTSKRAYLLGLSLNYGTTIEPGTPDTPVFETGFSALDDNKNSYTTNSVFATDNALSVYRIMSDGSHQSLSQGNNGYSYVIKNSSDVTINPTEPFPSQGIYTLVVSYGNYIPVEISLNVEEYVYVSDVAASMTTTTFNTADTLSNHLEGNLTANIEYSNGTTGSSIAYSEFEANGIAVKLTTPKGITHDMSKPFGTAGNWTLKVYSLTDENISYPISLTINAIPVQIITLNESSYALTVDDELQLVATVNPSTATNNEVIWSSNN